MPPHDSSCAPREVRRTSIIWSLLAVALFGVMAGPVTVEGHALGVSLSGFGSATLDGALSPGEWSSAGSANFLVNLPGGGTAPGQMFVMNDSLNLYLAVQFGATAEQNSAAFGFDNRHLGGPTVTTGDDGFILNPGIGFRDLVRVVEDGSAFSFFDTSLGGSNDGAGAFSNAGGLTVYEFSHPLDSGDNNHDFSLKAGDIVGFNLTVTLLTSDTIAQTFFPGPSFGEPSSFGDIVITPAVPAPAALLLLVAGLVAARTLRRPRGED